MKSKAGDFYLDGKRANADVVPLKAGNYDDMEPLKPPYKPEPGDETWVYCPSCNAPLGKRRSIYPPEEWE